MASKLSIEHQIQYCIYTSVTKSIQGHQFEHVLWYLDLNKQLSMDPDLWDSLYKSIKSISRGLTFNQFK